MSKKITEHATGKGSIQFMAAAKALMNQKAGKEEFSIRIQLPVGDSAVTHLSEIADYKVDTKNNRAMKDTGMVNINFTSSFAPKVLGMEGEELKGTEIPFFDGRKDSGEAVVLYKVIDYGNNKIVRLSGIRLVNLNLAARDESETPLDVTLETLKNIKA